MPKRTQTRPTQHYAFMNAKQKVVTTRKPCVSLKTALIAVDPHFPTAHPPTHYKELPTTYYSTSAPNRHDDGERAALTSPYSPGWQPLPLSQ